VEYNYRERLYRTIIGVFSPCVLDFQDVLRKLNNIIGSAQQDLAISEDITKLLRRLTRLRFIPIPPNGVYTANFIRANAHAILTYFPEVYEESEPNSYFIRRKITTGDSRRSIIKFVEDEACVAAIETQKRNITNATRAIEAARADIHEQLIERFRATYEDDLTNLRIELEHKLQKELGRAESEDLTPEELERKLKRRVYYLEIKKTLQTEGAVVISDQSNDVVAYIASLVLSGTANVYTNRFGRIRFVYYDPMTQQYITEQEIETLSKKTIQDHHIIVVPTIIWNDLGQCINLGSKNCNRENVFASVCTELNPWRTESSFGNYFRHDRRSNFPLYVSILKRQLQTGSIRMKISRPGREFAYTPTVGYHVLQTFAAILKLNQLELICNDSSHVMSPQDVHDMMWLENIRHELLSCGLWHKVIAFQNTWHEHDMPIEALIQENSGSGHVLSYEERNNRFLNAMRHMRVAGFTNDDLIKLQDVFGVALVQIQNANRDLYKQESFLPDANSLSAITNLSNGFLQSIGRGFGRNRNLALTGQNREDIEASELVALRVCSGRKPSGRPLNLNLDGRLLEFNRCRVGYDTRIAVDVFDEQNDKVVRAIPTYYLSRDTDGNISADAKMLLVDPSNPHSDLDAMSRQVVFEQYECEDIKLSNAQRDVMLNACRSEKKIKARILAMRLNRFCEKEFSEQGLDIETFAHQANAFERCVQEANTRPELEELQKRYAELEALRDYYLRKIQEISKTDPVIESYAKDLDVVEFVLRDLSKSKDLIRRKMHEINISSLIEPMLFASELEMLLRPQTFQVLIEKPKPGNEDIAFNQLIDLRDRISVWSEVLRPGFRTDLVVELACIARKAHTQIINHRKTSDARLDYMTFIEKVKENRSYMWSESGLNFDYIKEQIRANAGFGDIMKSEIDLLDQETTEIIDVKFDSKSTSQTQLDDYLRKLEHIQALALRLFFASMQQEPNQKQLDAFLDEKHVSESPEEKTLKAIWTSVDVRKKDLIATRIDILNAELMKLPELTESATPEERDARNMKLMSIRRIFFELLCVIRKYKLDDLNKQLKPVIEYFVRRDSESLCSIKSQLERFQSDIGKLRDMRYEFFQLFYSKIEYPSDYTRDLNDIISFIKEYFAKYDFEKELSELSKLDPGREDPEKQLDHFHQYVTMFNTKQQLFKELDLEWKPIYGSEGSDASAEAIQFLQQIEYKFIDIQLGKISLIADALDERLNRFFAGTDMTSQDLQSVSTNFAKLKEYNRQLEITELDGSHPFYEKLKDAIQRNTPLIKYANKIINISVELSKKNVSPNELLTPGRQNQIRDRARKRMTDHLESIIRECRNIPDIRNVDVLHQDNLRWLMLSQRAHIENEVKGQMTYCLIAKIRECKNRSEIQHVFQNEGDNIAWLILEQQNELRYTAKNRIGSLVLEDIKKCEDIYDARDVLDDENENIESLSEELQNDIKHQATIISIEHMQKVDYHENLRDLLECIERMKIRDYEQNDLRSQLQTRIVTGLTSDLRSENRSNNREYRVDNILNVLQNVNIELLTPEQRETVENEVIEAIRRFMTTVDEYVERRLGDSNVEWSSEKRRDLFRSTTTIMINIQWVLCNDNVESLTEKQRSLLTDTTTRIIKDDIIRYQNELASWAVRYDLCTDLRYKLWYIEILPLSPGQKHELTDQITQNLEQSIDRSLHESIDRSLSMHESIDQCSRRMDDLLDWSIHVDRLNLRNNQKIRLQTQITNHAREIIARCDDVTELSRLRIYSRMIKLADDQKEDLQTKAEHKFLCQQRKTIAKILLDTALATLPISSLVIGVLLCAKVKTNALIAMSEFFAAHLSSSATALSPFFLVGSGLFFLGILMLYIIKWQQLTLTAAAAALNLAQIGVRRPAELATVRPLVPEPLVPAPVLIQNR